MTPFPDVTMGTPVLRMDQLAGESVIGLFRRTVVQLRTVFGQLSFLASLRDRRSGRYQHVLFDNTLPDQSSHEVVKAAHLDVFRDWLSLSLEEQRDDLRQFFAEARGGSDDMIRRLWSSRALLELTPTTALQMERELFEYDLALILEGLLEPA